MEMKALQSVTSAEDPCRSTEPLNPLDQHIKVLYAALAASRDLIYVLNDKHQYVYANSSALNLLNLPLDALLGKRLRDVNGGWTHEALLKFEQETRSVFATGKSIRAESKRFLSEGVRFFEYVISPILADDSNAVHGVVIVSRDITDRIEAEDTIHQLAYVDALTGLPNRTKLEETLGEMVARCIKNPPSKLAVLLVNLDRFKNINDTLGHHIGNEVLRGVANRLVILVQSNGLLGRLGGDEFMVILPKISPTQADEWGHRILNAFKKPLIIGTEQFNISASIGGAIFSQSDSDVSTLLKNADIALHEAKTTGQGTFYLHTQALGRKASKRLSLENSMSQALERGQFVTYYQPIINSRTGKITKAEALLRWEHPQRGLILPDEFIEMAEENGTIYALGEWLISDVLTQCRKWRDAGISPVPRIAINLSPRQLNQTNLVDCIVEALKESRLDARQLEIEITETTIVQDLPLTISRLQELRHLGIRTAVDDFGSGYASLSYLKRLPIDTVKIDRLFVRDCVTSVPDAAILKAIISLAHTLKLKVTAEGVENTAQLALLLETGCDDVQGFLFGSPTPASRFARLLQESGQFFTNPDFPLSMSS